jgi:hypothetical protein
MLHTKSMRAVLLAGSTMIVISTAAFAQTDDPPRKHRHHAAAATENDRLDLLEKQVRDQAAAMGAQAREIQDLKAQLNQGSGQVSASQFEALQSQVYETQATIKTAGAVAPHDKKLHMKGVTFSFGGFLAAESVWRSGNLGSDIGSPGFSKIPFFGPGGGGTGNAVSVGHTGEFRLSARQTRVSGLVEGDFDPTTHFAAYGEFDFLGAAASANSNESNSYTPRIRNVYGTVDWSDIGVKFLFGQNWSLATLDGKGISERSELPPPTIDSQYLPGFIWTRQPQLRLVKNFNDELWLGLSVENPQTTTGGTAPTGFSSLTISTGNGFNGTTTNVALAEFNPGITLSLNHVPDVIGKVAWEPSYFDGNVHLEVFGIYRDFYNRVGTTLSDVQNINKSGGGGGISGLIKAVPGLLDVQFDGMYGTGIGRYGSGQLPDVTFRADGTFQPLNENMEMVGLTLHATHELDVYVFAGREEETKAFFNGALNGATQHIGYGNPLFVNTGCFSWNSVATCTGNVQNVQQVTLGLWDTAYKGDFGQFKIGLQYSYTHLKAFDGVGGSPDTHDQMVFSSFRYYPF